MADRVLGLEIGGTKCTAWLWQGQNLLGHRTFATLAQPEACLKAYEKAVDELFQQYPGPVQRVGISCGGPLDGRSGHILCPPNLPQWVDVAITDWAERTFHAPAALQNDADACALAEWRYGAGKGCESLVFLTFGTGLGSGLILGGKLWPGSCGMGGEVGHLRLAEAGPVGYGKIGSAEGFCSGGGIAQLGAAHALAARQSGRPVAWEAGPSAKAIAQAAYAGDATAQSVYRAVGERLGQTIAILIDLLNPQAVVIGGIYPRSGSLLEPSLRRVLEAECLHASLRACRILPAALGEEIGAYGTLAVAAEMEA